MDQPEVAKAASGILSSIKGAVAAFGIAGVGASLNRALSVKGLRNEIVEMKTSHAEEKKKNEEFREKMTGSMGKLEGMMEILVDKAAK